MFGTDGVRAVANAVLTPEIMTALGRALGVHLSGSASARRRVVVGRDPRPSSELLEAAFLAGLCSAGSDAITVGVVPTAAVAHLTTHFGAAAGAVITASHNPLEDNGLKLFDHAGYKYGEADEILIEELVHAGTTPWAPLRGRAVGRIRDHSHVASEIYISHLVAEMPDLDGVVLTVDCANGASATIAPAAYRQAGATVIEIAGDTSGNKINCGVGATSPEYLQKALGNDISSIGFAHDGDADRLVAVDELGRIVDGADLLAIFAVDAHQRGRLPHDGLVTTPMTNSGLGTSLADRGIKVVESSIGDRAVLRTMLANGYALGGEQNGHVISLARATTGDGILSGLLLLEIMHRSGKKLHELTAVWRRRPQRIVNIPVPDRQFLERATGLNQLVTEEREKLARVGGRLTVRLSTIEDIVRVVCEGPVDDIADSVTARVVADIHSRLEREAQG
ncbi:phosphoglucosamine mutase [Streptomyces sp. NBC_01275]|uniref:phosphoglucosamine mutase n=1 Tax=Streptomyces sp. NBC_01275 TaxID=2903807 RepID=UPI00225525CB|nr:phosphoglucosamine mutase [Streptomyces sp. NBC_01275]MCX4759956.1 phosphoglucosamine mutase [Streptomyces sp. NBC_01275]